MSHSGRAATCIPFSSGRADISLPFRVLALRNTTPGTRIATCVFLAAHRLYMQHRATAPRPDPTALRRILIYSPFATWMPLFHTYIRSVAWLRLFFIRAPHRDG